MIRIVFLLLSLVALLGAESVNIPTMDFRLSAPDSPQQLVSSLNVLVVLTLLFLAPSMILVMTTFTRFVIVFGFMRQAMGTQQVPPTQILIMLAMVLTFFVMEPIGQKAYDNGIKPYIEEKIGYEEAFAKTTLPFKSFMIRNTREKDLALFFRIRKLENPATVAEVPLSIVIPAFV
jgi:flagellar biosynthetic protein FliP